MDYRPSLLNLKLFLQRYQISLFFSLVAVLSSYLLLPLGASYLLSRGLTGQGYERVIVQLGYPGLWGIDIPVISLQQDLGGETLSVSITNAEIRYRVPDLLRGHVDRIFLPDVSIQLLNAPIPGDYAEHADDEERSRPLWRLTTTGDLLQRMPILPFEELILDRVTIFREEATGPLRKVTVSGTMTYREGELGGHLSFQGQDTASYGLTLAGNASSSWSAILVSQRLQAVPIVSWRSKAHPNGLHIQVDGQMDVNIREVAPFIALLVPIGPDLEKVTGRITLNWSGTAATDAVLTSLWHDSRTRLNGQAHAHLTLPALKGIAKEITLSYQGAFSGNAMQAEWTLDPGVPLLATVDSQPSFLHEAVRSILPHGEQALRVENSKPVHGTLYWAESPARMTIEGPMHVAYGTRKGPIFVELDTHRVEWSGNELSAAEGTYHIASVLPKAIANTIAAHSTSTELRGTLVARRDHVQGQILPSSSVTAKRMDWNSTFFPSITLELADTLSLQCDLSAAHCTMGPSTFAVRLPWLRMMGQEALVGKSVLSLKLLETTSDSWHTQGNLTLRRVVPDLAPLEVSPMDWTIRFLANQSGVQADLHIDAPFHKDVLVAELDQPLGSGKGRLHGKIGPIVFDHNEHRLSRLLKGLSPPVEIVQGQLSSSVDVTWSGGMHPSSPAFELVSGTATIVADKLTGQYGEFAVKNVSTTVTLQPDGPGTVSTQEPASISVEAIHTGVTVENIASMVEGRWILGAHLPVVELKDFRCEAFRGTITSPGLVADFSKPTHRMILTMHNMDLAEILRVEHNRDLEGTGFLHGTLPVSFAPGGLSIQEGTLSAISPGGVIRYGSARESVKVPSETDTDLHSMTQALSNFHYTQLQVGVDYAENGTLFLSAQLEGKNPALKKSPPINFNLTVQEHIPTLLKSLRLAEKSVIDMGEETAHRK